MEMKVQAVHSAGADFALCFERVLFKEKEKEAEETWYKRKAA